MNAPPDWQDGECCYRCRTQFTLVARKHHCRNCGNIFCAKCSSQQIPLPKLNLDKLVRVCDTCYEKVSGKNVDPLTLALDSKDKDQSKDQNPKDKSQSDIKPSTTKGVASASAPSEQELKEEEELQLALALSLSETPTKVSFPDYRHLEQPIDGATPTKTSISTSHNYTNTTANKSSDTDKLKMNNVNRDAILVNDTKAPTEAGNPTLPGYDLSAMYATVPALNAITQNAPVPKQTQIHQNQQQTIAVQPVTQPDYPIQDSDRELFKYIGDVQGTLDVFNNRLEACKLRNRPISNDAAIQSLFIKLNSEVQPKLSDHIKTYEDERNVYERLQDKLSQIADARAALDALREEHQEKMRQMAADAERQRQSQLAAKLEAMRQKKTQVMQYQRELAMQRLREQEQAYQPSMPHQQQVPTEYQVQTSGSQLPSQQPLTEQQSYEYAIQQQQPQPMVPPQQIPPNMVQQQQQQHWQHQPNQSYQYQQPYVEPTSQSSTLVQNHEPQSQPTQQYQYNSYIPQQHQQVQQNSISQPTQPIIDRASIAQLEKQFLPDAKPDEEAPLISFDD